MKESRTPRSGQTDWEAVKRRLRAVERALEGHESAAPDAAARVLEERARELARPVTLEATSQSMLLLLCFDLDHEIYAFEAKHVQGVGRLLDLAPLPGASDVVAGMALWRGELLSVLDLRRLLRLGATGLDDRAWLVAIGDDAHRRGVLAGAMRGMRELPRRELLAAERASPATPYLQGVTPDGVQLLDAVALLSARA